jgi:hypothetical protein
MELERELIEQLEEILGRKMKRKENAEFKEMYEQTLEGVKATTLTIKYDYEHTQMSFEGTKMGLINALCCILSSLIEKDRITIMDLEAICATVKRVEKENGWGEE